MRMLKKAFKTGEMRYEIGEVPPKGRISNTRKIMPYCERMAFHSSARSRGKKPMRILPPSKGWIGTRLKIARTRFKRMTEVMIAQTRSEGGRTRRMREKRMATVMFEAGPARPMRAASFRGFFKL